MSNYEKIVETIELIIKERTVINDFIQFWYNSEKKDYDIKLEIEEKCKKYCEQIIVNIKLDYDTTGSTTCFLSVSWINQNKLKMKTWILKRF